MKTFPEYIQDLSQKLWRVLYFSGSELKTTLEVLDQSENLRGYQFQVHRLSYQRKPARWVDKKMLDPIYLQQIRSGANKNSILQTGTVYRMELVGSKIFLNDHMAYELGRVVEYFTAASETQRARLVHIK